MSFYEDLKELPRALADSIHEETVRLHRSIKAAWPLLLLLLAGLIVVLWFSKPAPPKTVSMAVGKNDYSLAQGQRYVEYFKNNGIDLQLIQTEGANDSLMRLKNPKDAIQVAILQSGLVDNPVEAKGLVSLGSIAYEPIWLFYWGKDDQDDKKTIVSLLEQPISIGNKGSGTYVKALQLLKINGLTPTPNMLTLSESEAVAALNRHEISGMLLVENQLSPIVQNLLNNPNLTVANFIRAEAYSKLLRYIEVLHVPMGGFSLSRNYPDRDIKLLSTTTTLVADKDLHPAIQMLFMEASNIIAGDESFFSRPHEFPTIKDPTVAESDVARRYFQKGPPILNYYLPFWLAEFIERTGLLLLPFLAFAYPILKAIPDFILGRTRARINHHYQALKILENTLTSDFDASRIHEYIDALDQLEADALKIRIHKNLVSEFYALRNDIDFVRAALNRIRIYNR